VVGWGRPGEGDRSDTDRDGLSEYRWTGQVSDNSPMWDPYSQFGDGAGCGWVPPVASVPLNCFLIWDARHLARHANDLGFKADASAFTQRADDLQERLLRTCYVPAEKRFWDYNHHTRTHTKAKTFWMFWPLFAGVEMPRATRDSLLKALLDPAQFFGPVPFPSVAYNEPAYDARGYWRGRAWPHLSFFLLQTLVRLGHEKEARAAAARLVSWYSRQTGFLENICTDPAETKPHGFPDYNWGSAAFYLMATGDYLRPDSMT
jgi:glycogen debranching enzyme